MSLDDGGVRLSADQLTALRNLGRKHAGEEVDWICIADAQALTDLGLAERRRSGWAISAAGRAALAADRGEGEPSDTDGSIPSSQPHGIVVEFGDRTARADAATDEAVDE